MPSTPRFDVLTGDYTPFPEFGGAAAVFYRSVDGTRLAGSFKESGRHEMVLPFDEFVHVLAGSTTITVGTEEAFTLGPGQCCYLIQGSSVVFEMSEDFHDVTVLVSDAPIEL